MKVSKLFLSEEKWWKTEAFVLRIMFRDSLPVLILRFNGESVLVLLIGISSGMILPSDSMPSMISIDLELLDSCDFVCVISIEL